MPFVYALLVLTAFLIGCCLLALLALARGLWRARHQPFDLFSSTQTPLAPFDASAITPEILRVRTNFIQALHSRPHPQTHRAELLTSTSQAVAQCAYFKSRSSHDPVDPSSAQRPPSITRSDSEL
jgi:hypothetical protein